MLKNNDIVNRNIFTTCLFSDDSLKDYLSTFATDGVKLETLKRGKCGKCGKTGIVFGIKRAKSLEGLRCSGCDKSAVVFRLKKLELLKGLKCSKIAVIIEMEDANLWEGLKCSRCRKKGVVVEMGVPELLKGLQCPVAPETRRVKLLEDFKCLSIIGLELTPEHLKPVITPEMQEADLLEFSRSLISKKRGKKKIFGINGVRFFSSDRNSELVPKLSEKGEKPSELIGKNDNSKVDKILLFYKKFIIFSKTKSFFRILNVTKIFLVPLTAFLICWGFLKGYFPTSICNSYIDDVTSKITESTKIHEQVTGSEKSSYQPSYFELFKNWVHGCIEQYATASPLNKRLIELCSLLALAAIVFFLAALFDGPPPTDPEAIAPIHADLLSIAISNHTSTASASSTASSIASTAAHASVSNKMSAANLSTISSFSNVASNVASASSNAAASASASSTIFSSNVPSFSSISGPFLSNDISIRDVTEIAEIIASNTAYSIDADVEFTKKLVSAAVKAAVDTASSSSSFGLSTEGIKDAVMDAAEKAVDDLIVDKIRD